MMSRSITRLLSLVGKSTTLASLLLLAGCFASREPLITAGMADTPFADGSRVVEFTNCAGASGTLIGCTGYKRDTAATLSLRDGEYVVHPDAASNALANLPGMKSAGQDTRFFVKSIGGDLYVVELPLGDDAAASGPNYAYDLIRVAGDTAYFYAFSCEQNGDQAYVKSRALKGISSDLLVPTCEAASLAGLGVVFRDRIANGAVPDWKFEIQPKGRRAATPALDAEPSFPPQLT